MVKRLVPLTWLGLTTVLLVLGYQNCGGGFQSSLLTAELGSGQGPDSLGQQFFESEIVPMIQQSSGACLSCHGTPVAPDSIVNYQQARDLLDRNLFSESYFFQVISSASFVSHTGGKFCGDQDSSGVGLCEGLRTWWELEFSQSENENNNGGGDGVEGALNTSAAVTDRGVVTGYAYDPERPNEKLLVSFFVGGPAGQGVKVGDVLADDNRIGADFSGHYYQFQLPAEYTDGQDRVLYAYAAFEAPENLIGGAGAAFRAFGFTDEGRTYFQTNLRTFFTNNCNGCHQGEFNNYESAYNFLIVPSPLGGGTSSNNSFLNRIVPGRLAHNGGTYCNNANVGACALIQEWWRIEFDR